MTIELSEVCCIAIGQRQQSHRKQSDVFGGDLEKFAPTKTTSYSACSSYILVQNASSQLIMPPILCTMDRIFQHSCEGSDVMDFEE
jgi:hypothetical protein